MTITEFYSEFNKIVSTYDNQSKTTKEINTLLEKVKGETYSSTININVKEVVSALEEQKLNLSQIDEKDSEDYTEDYDDSYESSY